METTAAIVIIGDEILAGKFAEENAAYLLPALRKLGVAVRRVTMLPDDHGDIAGTVRTMSERYTYVFTSGGVGPTHDDITVAAIASAYDTAVIRHPQLEQVLRKHWGQKLQDANLRLADVPEGTQLVGTDERWPVAQFRNIFILPGVPALFRRKFESIATLLRGDPVHERRLELTAEEGMLAPHLNAVVEQFAGVKIGSYPRFGETFHVIVTIEGPDRVQVEQALEDLRKRTHNWRRE